VTPPFKWTLWALALVAGALYACVTYADDVKFPHWELHAVSTKDGEIVKDVRISDTDYPDDEACIRFALLLPAPPAAHDGYIYSYACETVMPIKPGKPGPNWHPTNKS
jgi:hypothetical protein